MYRHVAAVWSLVGIGMICLPPARGADLIPSRAQIKTDRPRVLLRPNATPCAVSLAQLKAGPRDDDFDRMLAQLQGHRSASAQAMVWLLSGDRSAAEKAIARMRAYDYPGRVDTVRFFNEYVLTGLNRRHSMERVKLGCISNQYYIG